MKDSIPLPLGFSSTNYGFNLALPKSIASSYLQTFLLSNPFSSISSSPSLDLLSLSTSPNILKSE